MGDERKDGHVPVLLEEAVHLLNVDPSGLYVDATYGRGGHSSAVLRRLNERGKLIVFDKDPEACEHALAQFGSDRRVEVRQESFIGIKRLAGRIGMTAAGILFDLGVSSPQLDDPRRGFSFQLDGPLDMRMDPTAGLSAREWLSRVSGKELKRVLRTYGEEPKAAQIAAGIKRGNPNTTFELANLVASTPGCRHSSIHKHPATRSFLAIRLYLNRELEELQEALASAAELLRIGGRLVVISFHSLEDRIVKRFVAGYGRTGPTSGGSAAGGDDSVAAFRKIDGLVRPGSAETARNPRARSARLRAAEKVSPGRQR